MKIAVVGASGFVGGAVAKYLVATDHEVLLVQVPRVTSAARRLTGLREDLLAAGDGVAEIAQQLTGCDVLINCAGAAVPESGATDELYGANALLPGLLVAAATKSRVPRVVHISSAAVHGNTKVLDAKAEPMPISPYGRSKLLGEVFAQKVANAGKVFDVELVVYRPTSVHGEGRAVTETVRKLARSGFSTVAAPGTDPTPQVLVENVAKLAVELAVAPEAAKEPVIHPWEGWTTSSFLEYMSGGKKPKQVPRRIARAVLGVAKVFGRFHAGIGANARRLEMLWFGQGQVTDVASEPESRPLTIGIVSHWFDPETGPASLPGSLARGLLARGHEVKVLTGIPNYPRGDVYPGYANRFQVEHPQDGLTVTRVPLFIDHSKSGLKRSLNYLSFPLSATLYGRQALDEVDVIWVYNSPPTVSWVARRASRRVGSPILTHIMDLWPDSYAATSFSQGRAANVLTGIFGRLATYSYKTSDKLAYISPGVAKVLENRGVRPEKLTYIPTWSEPNPAQARADLEPSKVLGSVPTQRTIVYAGAMGSVQGLDVVLSAFMKVEADLEFWLIGDGTEKAALQEMTAEDKRIHFVASIPQDKMDAVYAIADVMLVSLAPSVISATTTPSKFQQIIARGFPVLAVGKGDLLTHVTDAECGVAVDAEDAEGIAAAIAQVARASAQDLQTWSRAAQKYAEDQFDYEYLVSRVENELNTIIVEGRAKQ